MLIFINGSINSGKSTVANLLAKRLQNAIVFELDKIREQIEEGSLEKAIPLVHKRAIKEIVYKFNNEVTVIIPYPLSRESYYTFYDNLKDKHKQIFAFTLSPKKEIAKGNRGNRELNDWERQRIEYHYSMKINNPGYGTVIDNSYKTPKETVEEILSFLK